MKKDASIFIEHILECIGLIEEYITGKSKEDFMESSALQDSVIRRIEIIGEAIKNLPEAVKKQHTDVPWKNIAGMRDILIHEYFGVDLDLIFEVVRKDIPELKAKLSEIKKTLI